jgi:SanA protein
MLLKKRWFSPKRLLLLACSGLAIVLLTVFLCDRAVTRTAKGKTYTNVEKVPYNKTGLLLGTSKYLSDGSINLYYRYRIESAAALLRHNKIKYLVISGDNGREEYNEPEMMRADLMAAGIDSARIFLDYAGFRTFDSMVRLKKVFGQEQVTLVSQAFHNERALYIASREGIAAVGFNARDVDRHTGFRVQLREKGARVKLFLDYLFAKEPRFLGEKIVLPD